MSIKEDAEQFKAYLAQLGYVKPVQCKECVHYKPESSANECEMARWYKKWLTDFDYCSRAERKEE